MELITKTYDQLTLDELYAILHLRTQVFVVEQDSVYQDMDYHDQVALHLLVRDDTGRLVGYIRLLPPGEDGEHIHLGRLITVDRGQGIGTWLLHRAIDIAHQHWGASPISIMAQTYVQSMYERAGFVATSAPYIAEGREHIDMIRL